MRLVCWILASLVCCVGVAAFNCSSTVEFSSDRKGSDLRGFDLDSPDHNLCSKACCDDARCLAWTYVRPGVQSPKARCWLKNNTGVSSPNPDTTSGVVAASCDSSIDRGIDRPNNDYHSWDMDGADAKTCLTACCRDDACGAWSYQPPGARGPRARCYLKNNQGSPVSDATATSGVIRTRFNNPIVAGDAPDPGVLFWNNTYYMVVTSGLAPDAFPIRTSKDLATWTRVGVVFPAWSANKNPSWASGDFWAPELHLVPATSPPQFRLTFTARAKTGALSIGVAVASSPLGPFRDIGTPLFTSNYFLAKLQPPGFEYADTRAAIIRNTLAQLQLRNNNQNNASTSKMAPMWFTSIHAAKMNANMTALTTQPQLLFGDDQDWELRDIEAPWVVKRAAYYYIFYSGSVFDAPSYAIGIARATSMLGPWTKLAPGASGHGNPIVRTLSKSPRSWLSPGHCSVIPVREIREDATSNSVYALVYHGWPQDKSKGRAALLDAIEWDLVMGSWPAPSIRGGVSGGEIGVASENTKPIPGVKT